MKNLRKAAEVRGHSIWAKGPDNAGSYNSTPHGTGFFRDGGEYDSYYGRFFLNWYSQTLVDHGDRVLALANLAFEGTCIASKVGFRDCFLARKQVIYIFYIFLDKVDIKICIFSLIRNLSSDYRPAFRYTLVVQDCQPCCRIDCWILQPCKS